MATITYFPNKRAAVRVRAQVRLADYKSTAKSFFIDDQPNKTRAEAVAAAKEWAEKLEAELRAQSTRGTPSPDVTQLTVGGLIREHLRDPGITALRAFKDKERLLAWWLNAYGAEKVLDFGVRALHAARAKLHTAKRGDATTNRYISEMRAAWNWGRDSGLLPQERAWPRRLMLKEPRGRVRYLNDTELAAVLKAGENDTVMYATIVVSVATGLRQGELLRLKWSDLDLDSAKVTVHESKNEQRRTVHLPAPVVAALKVLQSAAVRSLTTVFLNTDGKPLRKGTLETRWRKIRSAAGLEDFHWHDLRHSCASYLAQNGASLLEIGSVLGHRSPSMTMRYSHLIQGKAVTGHDKIADKLRGKP